jgi:hypothetical protein
MGVQARKSELAPERGLFRFGGLAGPANGEPGALV